MASRKIGVQPPQNGNGVTKVIPIDEQSAQRSRLTRLEKQARREAAQSIRLAAYCPPGMGGGGTSGFNNSDIKGADSNFYSPQLSTDFLELPQSEREKRELIRFWYLTNPIVGASIDFHTDIPMSKIRLSLPKGKDSKRNHQILHFFEQMSDRVRLFQTLYDVTHEYMLHGTCCLGSTWVRTDRGHKLAENIKIGDKLLTHKGRFRKVTATCSRIADSVTTLKFDGIFESSGFNNHPIEINRNGKFSFVKSEEIKIGDYARVTWPVEVNDIEKIEFTNGKSFCSAGNGYVARRTSIGKASKDQVRSYMIGWCISVLKPTARTLFGISRTLGVREQIVSQVVASLEKEAHQKLFERNKTSKAGSETIWNPLNSIPKGWAESAKFDGTFFNLPNSVEIDEQFSYALGAWLASGKVKKINGVNIWYVDAPYEFLPKLRFELSRMFGDCVRVVGRRLVIDQNSNPAFVNWWSKEFKTVFPSWLSTLPLSKQKALLDGYTDFGPSTEDKIYCRRPKYITLLRDILLRLGKIPTLESSDVRTKGTHVLFPNKTPDHKKIGNDVAIRVIDVATSSKASVYNFQVEEDETYQAGFVSTHNCFIFAEDHDVKVPEELMYDTAEEEVGEIDEEGNPILVKEMKSVQKPEQEQKDIIWKHVQENYKGWQRLRILPPEQVRLEVFQYTDRVKIDLIPSEKDRLVVMKAMQDGDEDAMKIAEGIPAQIRDNLETGQPIPLNSSPYDDYLCSSFVHYLSHKRSAYDDRGISMVERCLRTLLQLDKLRQAQSSIASRAMTPKRVVWADKMSSLDTEDLRDQVDQALIDPDFSIVSNFEVHWDEIGARDRLLDLSSEYENLNKQLYIGLRITESMLTGESSYSGERIHLDVMNTMYLLYRESLCEYVEKSLFAPVAIKKGFWEIDEYGNKVLLYPKVHFTRLALRDNSELQDFMFNLYQKGSLPIDYILELINIDSDDAHARLKKDLFTQKDAVFNELIKKVLDGAGETILEKTDVIDRLIKNLGLNKTKPEGKDRFNEE